ncbi:MAG: hypothetical protein IT385_21775 [Deltaproteobacteria bacterium]|nr:hypothetical protein [Deltaproteobacteria bacterium]
MILGRVTGTVVSTVEHPFYDGKKQLIVRYLKPDGEALDGERYVVAIDLHSVGAGVGDTVIVIDEGNSARQILATGPHGPVRSVIVGIVDQVALD